MASVGSTGGQNSKAEAIGGHSVAADAADRDLPGRPMALECEHLSKRFGARLVLDDVSLAIAAGEIRGLVGQNGSGKSTLVKILSGYHVPEPAGRIRISGSEVSLPVRPGHARSLGVAFVHQDLALAPKETVVDNLRLNLFDHGPLGGIRWLKEREAAEESVAALGLRIDVRRSLQDLSPAEQTVVAIARAIGEIGHRQAGVLVLDEATATLPLNAVEQVVTAVGSLRERGVGILYISHRLEEIFELTDTVTVLRDGVVVIDDLTTRFNRRDLVTAIVGSELDEYERFTEGAEAPTEVGTRNSDALSIEGLCGPILRGVTLRGLRVGQIIGLTGLIGSGFEELPYVLYGARAPADGRAQWQGETIDLSRLTPREALRKGLALLPADRLKEGGLTPASVRENVTLPRVHTFWKAGWLRLAAERRVASELLHTFQVQPPNSEALFGMLSGGNQQKALLGRELSRSPMILMLVEPTHGIDVGTKAVVMSLLRQYADAGHLVLIASSEYEEVATLCDRAFVFREGRLTGELAGQKLTRERIVESCYASNSPVDGPGPAAQPHGRSGRECLR